MLIAFLLLSASCILGLLAFNAERGRISISDRLEKHIRVDGGKTSAAAQADLAFDGAALPAWLSSLAAIGEKLSGGGTGRHKLERLVVQAGWRRKEALGLLMLAKVGLGLCLMLPLLPFDGGGLELRDLAFMLGALFVGNMIPEAFLKMRAAKRHNSILRSMPDGLDLMVICAEAGLPFPRILKVVSRELELSSPVLADELAVTSAELQLLPDRTNALRHLAERTGVPTVESMVATLIQAERYGTPLAQALRNIAEESRNTLILTLEEKAGKLPARLSIPLMTLILPPVVALVATPALMRVIRSLM